MRENCYTPARAMCRLTERRDYYYNVIVMIGNYEYLVLSAAARLGPDAYGASVMKEIAATHSRHGQGPARRGDVLPDRHARE